MYALPPETDDFPGSFPSFGWLPLDSCRNKVVVGVEFDVTPALYAPADGKSLETSPDSSASAPPSVAPDARTLHIRTATVAEPAQQAVYDALGIEANPGGVRRTVV